MFQHLRFLALKLSGKHRCPVRYARYPDLRPSPYAGHIYNGGGRPVDPSGPSTRSSTHLVATKTHWIGESRHCAGAIAHLLAGGRPREGIVPGAPELSVEECAILQTFPRDLAFAGKQSSQYRQVGDAVPPDPGLYCRSGSSWAVERCHDGSPPQSIGHRRDFYPMPARSLRNKRVEETVDYSTGSSTDWKERALANPEPCCQGNVRCAC